MTKRNARDPNLFANAIKNKATVRRVVKDVAKIKRVIGPDNPGYITSPYGNYSTSITSALPFVVSLLGMPQGLDEINGRRGDQIRFAELDMRLHLTRTLASSAGANFTVRVLLVRETTCLGSDIALAQLFNSATPNPMDTWNVTTRDHRRFKVMYDSTFIMGPYTTSTATTLVVNGALPNQRCIHIKRKLNFVTDYSRGNVGTVADIEKNNLSLIVLTNNGAGTDLTMAGSHNIKFYA